MLIWGAGGGLGGYALQYVLAGGGYPVCVVSSEAKAQKCREAGAEWIINRAEEQLRVLGSRDGPAEPARAPAAGQEDPRAERRPRRRHRLRAPGPRHVRRQRVRHAPRRQGRHVRVDDGLHARVRQPLPVDVREDDRRLAPRQLPRGLGRQRALPRRAHASDPEPQLPAERGGPGLRRRATTTPTSARSACCAWPTARARACSTTSCARGICRCDHAISQLIALGQASASSLYIKRG